MSKKYNLKNKKGSGLTVELEFGTPGLRNKLKAEYDEKVSQLEEGAKKLEEIVAAKEKLEAFKFFSVREGTPEDLTKAIQTFIQQAIIIGEHELDAMPPEYMENLLSTMSKYPEYNKVTLDLIEILKNRDLWNKILKTI